VQVHLALFVFEFLTCCVWQGVRDNVSNECKFTLHCAIFLVSDLGFGSSFGWNINSTMWVQVHLALFTVLTLTFDFWQQVCDQLCKLIRHRTPTMSYVPDVRHRISMSPCTGLIFRYWHTICIQFGGLNINRDLWVQVHLALHYLFLVWLVFCMDILLYTVCECKFTLHFAKFPLYWTGFFSILWIKYQQAFVSASSPCTQYRYHLVVIFVIVFLLELLPDLSF
jgi:hypothetical protein